MAYWLSDIINIMNVIRLNLTGIIGLVGCGGVGSGGDKKFKIEYWCMKQNVMLSEKFYQVHT